MKLFEIDNEIEKILYQCSESDGVLNEDLEARLDALEVAKEVKVLNTALAYKNEAAFLKALKGEKKNIEARIKSQEVSVKKLEKYLDNRAKGYDLKSEKVAINWRKSSYLDVTNELAVPEKYLSIKTTIKKDLITEAIKKGEKITYAEIVGKQTLKVT